MQTNTALKEWAIAIAALEAGEMVILLRKGGIHEQFRRFAVPDTIISTSQVLLYPTYEHQKPELLKPPYGDRVKPVETGWHPQTVTIRSIATLTNMAQITHEIDLIALQPHHIWQPAWAFDRLRWKPQEPLSILFLRVAQLAQPHHLTYRSEYGGCRSWLALNQAIDIRSAVPVLSRNVYEQRVQQIRASIHPDCNWVQLPNSISA